MAYGQFSNNDLHGAFDEDVKTTNSTALRITAEFVRDFLNPALLLQFVRCLLDMIETDEYIQTDDEFYITSDTTAVKAKDICKLNHFFIEPFLLGVWHYIIMNRVDNNEKSADTYKEWYPSKGNYRGTVGNGITRKIFVDSIPVEQTQDTDNTETFAADDEPQVEVIDSDGNERAESITYTQYIENATIVNQTSEKNIHIDHVDTLNL